MASIISAGLTSGTSLNLSGDTSGVLQLASNGSTTAVTIDTNQRAAFVAGTAALPAITTTGDTNTGIFFPAADTIAFAEGGAEAMRIDSSGNVGIGTTSPQSTVGVNVALTDTKGVVLQYNGEAKGGILLNPTGGEVRIGAINTTGTYFTTFYSNNAERMRIDSSGNVGIATTSPATYGQLAVRAGVNGTYFGITANSTLSVSDATNSTLAVLHNNSNSGTSFIGTDAGGRLQLFCSSTAAGGVYLANAGTSWTSASDERVKENLVPIENGLAKVASLRAVTGNYINDETKKPKAFLIAQDVQSVLPEAVDSSNPDELGLAYTDVIPLLVASIKELKAELDATKAEVQALKGVA